MKHFGNGYFSNFFLILMKSEKLISYCPKTLILTNFANNKVHVFGPPTFLIFRFHQNKDIKLVFFWDRKYKYKLAPFWFLANHRTTSLMRLLIFKTYAREK